MLIGTFRDEHTGEKRIVAKRDERNESPRPGDTVREARKYLHKAMGENPEETSVEVRWHAIDLKFRDNLPTELVLS